MTLSLRRNGRKAGALMIAAAMIAAAIAAALGASGGPHPAMLGGGMASVRAGAVSPQLERAAQAGPGRRVEVVVQLASHINRGDGRALVEALGGTVTRDLGVVHAFGARLPAGKAVRLSDSRVVRGVSLRVAQPSR